MKKKSVIFTLAFVILAIAVTPFISAIKMVYASVSSSQLSVFENITHEIFGNLQIESCEYLYTVDGSPDYVYVDFSAQGYAIYDEATMDILEYSLSGNSPYENISERKYYSGPSYYFIKDGEEFVNLSDGSRSVIAENQIQYTRQQVANDLQNEECVTYNVPVIDEGHLIPATPPGAVTEGYISNAQYFVNNPTHGYNDHGTCGSVAGQLLLSYNNYHVDRRIIAPEHLNGGWNNALGNNDVFDARNYLQPSKSPYACTYPNSASREVLGSNDDFYNYVIANLEPDALSCIHTVTTVTLDYSAGTTTITVTKEYPDGRVENISSETRPTESGDKRSKVIEHSYGGSLGGGLSTGLGNVLKSRIGEDEFEVKRKFGITTVDSAEVKSEIDAGRPLMLGMWDLLGGINHWVVGYGYQDYTYPASHPDAGKTYSGYVVHFGWTGKTNIWINQAWCNQYISLE